MKKGKTTNAVKILQKHRGKDPVRKKRVEIEIEQLRLYQMIAEMREKAGLSQKELAKLMGTTQSVVSRTESGDYNRLTVTTLLKVAQATGHRLTIEPEAV